MVFAGNLDLGYWRTPVTRKTAVIPSASVTSTLSPGRRAPRRKKTAGPWELSRGPSVTDAPIWPRGAQYLYHAPPPALAYRDRTWVLPSALAPRGRRPPVT